MLPLLEALAGTPLFSRLSREVYNSGHNLLDVESIESQRDISGYAGPGGFVHYVPVSVRYVIHFSDGSVTYCSANYSDYSEADRFKTILEEIDTWDTEKLLKAANAICQMIVNRTIKTYKSHEDNNDNGNYDRTPAAPRYGNTPAAPVISSLECKKTSYHDRVSSKFTFSTDDPEAAPRISPAD